MDSGSMDALRKNASLTEVLREELTEVLRKGPLVPSKDERFIGLSFAPYASKDTPRPWVWAPMTIFPELLSDGTRSSFPLHCFALSLAFVTAFGVILLVLKEFNCRDQMGGDGESTSR